MCPDGQEYRYIFCRDWVYDYVEGMKDAVYRAMNDKNGDIIITIKDDNIIGIALSEYAPNSEDCYHVLSKEEEEKGTFETIKKKKEIRDIISENEIDDAINIILDMNNEQS